MISPVRKLGLSGRSLTGYMALRVNPSAAFESSLEKDLLILLDFDLSVRSIAVQPFRLHYEHDGRTTHYTPDIAATHERPDGTTIDVVYEVKPYDVLKAKWDEFRPRFLAANQYCRSRGARFSIMTEREIRTPRLKNAALLRGFITRPDDPQISDQLLNTIEMTGPTTPQGLLAAAFIPRDQQRAAIPFLWRLVALRLIAADLDRPLTMASTIAPAEV
jgi:hypothetical protein